MSSPRKAKEERKTKEEASKPGSRGGSRGASRNTSKSSVGGSGDGASKGAKPSRPPSTSSMDPPSKSTLKGGKKPPLQREGATGAADVRPPGPPFEKNKPLTKAERRELQEAQRRAKAEKNKGPGGKVGEGTAVERQQSSAGSGKTEQEDHSKMDHSKMVTRQRSSSHKMAKSSSQDNPPQKQVQLFTHLPQYSRALPPTRSSDFTVGSIPPCIVKLGLQYSEGIICGSNARCIALLAAFKKVIQSYSTPPKKELRRDLDATIKPYISFLSKCRPLSVSMGNAIKHLKLKISNIPPDLSEAEAKKSLCVVIDDYLKDKIHLADEAISGYCLTIINDDDVILVHAYSSIVQRALMDAHKAGKKFRVIVADSRPKLEGRHCLRQLVQSGIKCSYIFINAVSYIMKEVSKVIVGAHGLLANGYVMSRVGTSLIALVAKSYNVPFLVCCETYKFCDKVQTDSFVINELSDPNDLVPIHKRQGDYLTDWTSIDTLNLLNLVYDVTSPDLITMVITQVGLIPCTSVPVVLRISRDLEQMQTT